MTNKPTKEERERAKKDAAWDVENFPSSAGAHLLARCYLWAEEQLAAVESVRGRADMVELRSRVAAHVERTTALERVAEAARLYLNLQGWNGMDPLASSLRALDALEQKKSQ